MSNHTLTLRWQRDAAVFTDNRYSRAHTWQFDGGATVRASSSPVEVREPWSDPAGVDPEEAFVAAIASCHMLWFLSLAANAGLRVDAYRDDPVGTLATDDAGVKWMARVTLAPHAVVSGERLPTDAQIEALHHESHRRCFIAASVKSAIDVKATWSAAEPR